MNRWERLKYEFQKGDSPVRKLIIINVAVFVFTLILNFFAFLYNTSAQELLIYFELPSWAGVFLKRPWTLFTYMFLHAGIWHLVFNMLFLYFIGRILEDFVSNKKFYTVFFGGGLLGGILYLIAYNTFPVFTAMDHWVPMLGASGAVTAVIVAAATLVPNYQIYLYGLIRMRLVWLAVILVAMDVAFFPNGNSGGRLAHLGGALFGFLYIQYIRGSIGFDLSFLNRIRNPFKPRMTIIDERKIRNERKGKKSKPGRKSDSKRPNQDEIDSILDKINQSGYSSLSKDEKDILFKASE